MTQHAQTVERALSKARDTKVAAYNRFVETTSTTMTEAAAPDAAVTITPGAPFVVDCLHEHSRMHGSIATLTRIAPFSLISFFPSFILYYDSCRGRPQDDAGRQRGADILILAARAARA